MRRASAIGFVFLATVACVACAACAGCASSANTGAGFADPEAAPLADAEARDAASPPPRDGVTEADASPRDADAPRADARAAGDAGSLRIDHWMEDARIVIQDRALAELRLPGTHDSATYGLIDTLQRPANDLFAPDADGVLVQLGSLTSITRAWSQTQERTIAQQLEDGIRTVDLRVCVDRADTLRLCHGLYGPTFASVLQDVAAFASTHTKEVVVLYIDGFTDWTASLPDGGPSYGNMSDANVTRVKAMITQTLGPALVDHAAFTPASTLRSLWDGQPGKTIAVLFGRDPAAPFWSNAQRTRSWRDTWHEGDKKASLDDALKADALVTPPTTLFQLSGEVTDDATLIELSKLPASAFPQSLMALADAANPMLLGWIAGEWSAAHYRMNAVQVDFYDRSCLVPLLLTSNGITDDAVVHARASCTFGATAWPGWWNEPIGAQCLPDDQCQSKHCRASVCSPL